MAGSNPIAELHDSLQAICAQLKDREVPCKDVEAFNREEFWRKLAEVTRLVHLETTKFSVSLEKPPLPAMPELKALVNSLERSCIALLSVFTELPRSQGLTLRLELSDCIREVFNAVMTLLVAVRTNSPPCHRAAASCWEKCNALDATSKDNKEAVTSILSGQYGVVQDAAEELDLTIRTDDTISYEGERVPVRNGFTQPRRSTWSLQDRLLLSPGLGLVKTAKVIMRKVMTAVDTKGRCDTTDEIFQLDKVAELVRSSSTYVDEFVMSLYPPVFEVAVRENANELKNHVLAILEATKESHFYDASEEWADFLETVVEHNFQNLWDTTSGS